MTTETLEDPVATEPPPPQAQSDGGGRLVLALLVTTGAIVWTNWAVQLSIFWDEKSYYNYGWAVPFLAVFLLWRRLSDSPPAQSPSPLGMFVAVAGLLLLPAVQLATEAIPNWRMVAWLHTGTVILLSVGLAIVIGGRRVAAHIAFPIVFLGAALPWPMRFEIPIISNLTEGVVYFTVESLRFFAIPAVYTGNVIEIGSRTVMVGDVCSGIRSLQALVMVGLFFGELFRHGIAKRTFLVFAAGFFAFAFNCLRALTLTLMRPLRGTRHVRCLARLGRWHRIRRFLPWIVRCFGTIEQRFEGQFGQPTRKLPKPLQPCPTHYRLGNPGMGRFMVCSDRGVVSAPRSGYSGG